MSDPTPIATPAGFVPGYAVGFADPSRNVILVSEADPLPVASAAPGPAPAPVALEGQASAPTEAGPFAAVPGRVVTVTLAGSWQGSATLLRSTDGGATRHPLRVVGEPWAEFTRSGCEQAWLETEEGASFYLDIQLDSGTLDYRVSQ